MRAPLAPGALAPSSAGAPSMRAGTPHTGPLLTGTAEMARGSTSGRTPDRSHIPRWQRDGDRHRMGKQPQHQMLVGTCSCRRNTISNSDLHVAGRKGNTHEASSQSTCFVIDVAFQKHYKAAQLILPWLSPNGCMQQRQQHSEVLGALQSQLTQRAPASSTSPTRPWIGLNRRHSWIPRWAKSLLLLPECVLKLFLRASWKK